MSQEPEYLEVHIREALAADPRVGEPNLEVSVRGRMIQVSGRVGSLEHREGVRQVVSEMCPGYEFRSHLEISDLRPPGEGEKEQL